MRETLIGDHIRVVGIQLCLIRDEVQDNLQVTTLEVVVSKLLR